MSRVVVFGSINVDLVVAAPRLPLPGETVLGGRFEHHFGGKGANQAVAAARAGASVLMVGAAGRDPNGDASLEALAAEGVDVSRVRRVDAPTGVAIIAVGPDGENQIVVAPGANAELTAEDGGLAGLPLGDGVLLASLEVPIAAVIAAIAAAAERGMPAILNAAPGQRLPDAILVHRPILVLNQGELLVATGALSPEQALASLAAAGVGPLIVTRSAGGVLLADLERRVELPAHRVERVMDTTGAGDTFAGVLAAFLAGGASVRAAVEAANVAAGLSVQQDGARGGMPTRAEIEEARSVDQESAS
ncbi:MAG TPA: PfkB family carbohydrate kinase [Candidatus Dormibacteraeota bacterium]|nr:PfkB family carbohydrate kinase [Candidatus Dormibacteraeota bacterium]